MSKGVLDWATARTLFWLAQAAYGFWREGDPRFDWAWEEIRRLADAATH